MASSSQPHRSSCDQPQPERRTSEASSVAVPISLSFSSSLPSSETLDLDYHAPGGNSGLPYLDSLPSLAPQRDSIAPQRKSVVPSTRTQAQDKRESNVLPPAAAVSPRLAPAAFDSPSLAHLSSSRSSFDSTATASPKDTSLNSPTIDRGAIRSASPYNSPDITITVPGSTAFTQEQEKKNLFVLASNYTSEHRHTDNTSTSSKRYSKVLNGLGLFGAGSKRKNQLARSGTSSSSNTRNSMGLRVDTSIPMEDPLIEEADDASSSSGSHHGGGLGSSSKPRPAGVSPLPSPGHTYKAPTAHHLLGGLGISHPQGLSSSSSIMSHEKYPSTQSDAFSNGLVPVLNIDDSSSSIYSSSSPRRPYAPGSFTNGPRTPLSATASPNGSSFFFDEKKLGNDSPAPSIFAGSQDIKMWGDYDAESEPDDYLHEPDAEKDAKAAPNRGMLSPRGLLNIGTLAIIGLSLIALFGGYPVFSWLSRSHATTKGGFNLGGINATGQVADLHIGRDLVDPDTPDNVKTRRTLDGTNRQMNLVFSDEFNRDGRSFYPGDDPFWTAVDLHYWGTENYEWYDPSSVTTANGSLVITLDQIPTHNLNFRGGMLQSWNQMCFTGGYIEVSMVLPGAPDVPGLWPAAWTMGNLGRAGYGATTDGMWPYTYDTCDVGTLPNQTYANGTGPIAAQTTGVYVEKYGPYLSYLPGQRLSRCTCADSDDHPGPKHADGTWVGRSAPEIDIIEAAAAHTRGQRGFASMSAQIAPFNTGYNLSEGAGTTEFFSPDAELNSYTGSPYQQAASGLVYTDRYAYQDTLAQFSSYGFEYNPGSDPDSYILWTRDGQPMWKLNSAALGPDAGTQIGQRPIPYEPMYILLNLGISASFTTVDWRHLNWPAQMLVDYVRVWQVEGEENVGCDPENAPTAAYIEKHKEAYYNANLTTYTETRERGGYGQKFPGNSMLGQC